MTTPNIEELIAKLRTSMGDLDCPNTYEFAMHQAADALQSQAERIKELEAENGKLSDLWSAMKAKRDTLCTQLSAIAATEPVAWRGRCTDPLHDWCLFYRRQESQEKFLNMEWQPLFTRPMPAQDVTELVEALEKLARLGNCEHYGNSDGNMIARDALSKYKGAK